MGIRREGSGSAPLIRLRCLIGKEETCVGRGVTLPVPLRVRPRRRRAPDTEEQRGRAQGPSGLLSPEAQPSPRRGGRGRGERAAAPSPSAQLGQTRPREKTVVPKVAEGMRKLVQRAVALTSESQTGNPDTREVFPEHEEGSTARHVGDPPCG